LGASKDEYLRGHASDVVGKLAYDAFTILINKKIELYNKKESDDLEFVLETQIPNKQNSLT